ncbi:MAG: cell fate regulator YaaT (PSP1 superfamily), partial [Sphingobacteriales bacterium]
MGCTSCSSGGAPAGCNSNGSCMTDGGCGKMDVFDWLNDIDSPNAGKSFDIVEVRFKGSRKEYFHNENNIYVESGNLVAVEGPLGGYDIGHVTLTGELVRLQLSKNNISPESDEVRKLYRLAHEKDVDKWKEVKGEETKVMHRARFHAKTLALQMKISDVEIQGDRKKGTFFYTAESRVDFRELLKLLADEFRFRIEMRQIGMRQEAGRLGGIGSCGRELCCTTWLTNFKTVSTSAARYQN